MFDMSLSFRKVKPNVYAFTPGFVYASKVYFVTYKEKQAIENILYSYMQHTITATSGLPISVIISPKIGIPISVLLFFWGYYQYKRGIKEIIGTREKQPYERQTVSGHVTRMAMSVSSMELTKLIFVSIFLLLFAVFFILDYPRSGNPWSLFGLISLSFLGISTMILNIACVVVKYHKRITKEK